MGSRLWLLAPAAALYAGDVGVTLTGQPGVYWAAVEANPVAYPLLAHSPWLFAGLAAVWLAVLSAVVVGWRHPAAGWVAVFVAAAHAVGGASWLTRLGPWGLVGSAVYLAAAAQFSAWCWRRYARVVFQTPNQALQPTLPQALQRRVELQRQVAGCNDKDCE